MLVRDICIVESNNYQQNENWSYFNYLDTGNLTKNKIDSLQSINSVDDLPSRAKQKVTINDILYSSVRPNQQHYGFIDQQYDNLLVSTGFIILRPIIQKVIPKYLYYYLTQDKITNQLQVIAQNSTSSYPSITKDDLLNLEIHLPPIEEQEKIALILTKIDKQIGRNNAMVKKLQVLGKAIFEQFAINSTNNINVKKIANVIWGQCPEGKNILIEKINNSIPYASGAGDIDDGKLVINPKAYTNNSRRIVKAKTICMSVAGTIGKIGIAEDETSIGRAMLGLYSNSKYGLIYFALLKYSLVLQTQAIGAIQKIINNDHLDIIDMPDLSNSQIDKLNIIVDECIIVEKNTQKLTHLKEKLLPLLINGQLE